MKAPKGSDLDSFLNQARQQQVRPINNDVTALLDSTLKIWTYRVFSNLSTSPHAPADGAKKRSLLARYVETKVQEARQQVHAALALGIQDPSIPTFVHGEPTWLDIFALLCPEELPQQHQQPQQQPLLQLRPISAAHHNHHHQQQQQQQQASPVSSSEASSSSMSASEDDEKQQQQQQLPSDRLSRLPAGFELHTAPVLHSHHPPPPPPQPWARYHQQQPPLVPQIQVTPTWHVAAGGSRVRRLNLSAAMQQVSTAKRKKKAAAAAAASGVAAAAASHASASGRNDASSYEETRKRNERAKRFLERRDSEHASGAGSSSNPMLSPAVSPAISPAGTLAASPAASAAAAGLAPVVGRSSALEKAYSRLCGPPDPACVRPPAVLARSFEHCMQRFAAEGRYAWIDEQLRAIRQDLTVQAVKAELSLRVYETHARLALQNRDLGQFNQCQSQLHELHSELSQPLTRREEFLFYRIVYLSLMNMQQAFLKLRLELGGMAGALALPAVRFALALRAALVSGNFVRAQKLLAGAPFLGTQLADFFLDKLRARYVLLLCHSHYQAPLHFLAKQLRFDSEDAARQFLERRLNVQWVDAAAPPARLLLACKPSAALVEASPLLQQRKLSALG